VQVLKPNLLSRSTSIFWIRLLRAPADDRLELADASRRANPPRTVDRLISVQLRVVYKKACFCCVSTATTFDRRHPQETARTTCAKPRLAADRLINARCIEGREGDDSCQSDGG
jgi:hypothetical protein